MNSRDYDLAIERLSVAVSLALEGTATKSEAKQYLAECTELEKRREAHALDGPPPANGVETMQVGDADGNLGQPIVTGGLRHRQFIAEWHGGSMEITSQCKDDALSLARAIHPDVEAMTVRAL